MTYARIYYETKSLYSEVYKTAINLTNEINSSLTEIYCFLVWSIVYKRVYKSLILMDTKPISC